MPEELLEGAVALLGLDEDDLGAHHMAIRAVVVFIFAIFVVRIGEKRFIGKNTAFDVILGVMLGSVISRAITGQSPFFPTLVAAVVLVGLHWIFARLSFSAGWIGTLIKGSPRVLIRDGKIDWDAMRRSHLSENDLLSALRLREGMEDWSEVKEARLERNGEISVIRRPPEDHPRASEN